MKYNLETVCCVLDSLHAKKGFSIREISSIAGISRRHTDDITKELERQDMVRSNGYPKAVIITHQGMMLKWAIKLSQNMIHGQKDRIYPSLEQLVLFSNFKKWEKKKGGN